MKILFDTNVILDVLLERGDFFQESLILVNNVELSRLNGYLSASSIATIYYITQKAFSRKKAEKEIELLAINYLSLFFIGTKVLWKPIRYPKRF